MKKLFFLILLLNFISCSQPSSNNDNKKDDSGQSFTLEGTVVKIFNQIIPSAHATSFAILLSGSDKCNESNKCAFLIGINDDKEILLAAAPVINDTFKFRLPQKPAKDKIYKVIVRGWNPEKKEPISGADNREIVFKGSEIINKVEITPESTLSASKKLELLREGASFFSIIRDFINNIYEKFQNQSENLRDTIKRLIEDSGGEITILLNSLSNSENTPEINLELYIQKLSIKKWTDEKLRSTNKSDLFLFIDELNKHISEAQRITDDLLSEENFGEIISNSYSQQNQYLIASQKQDEIILDEEAAQNLENDNDKIDASNVILNKYDEINSNFDQAKINDDFINEKCPKFDHYIKIKLMKNELEEYKLRISQLNEEMALVPEEDRPLLTQKLMPIADSPNDLNEEERFNIMESCNKEKL